MNMTRRRFFGLGVSSLAAAIIDRSAFGASLPDGYGCASDFSPTPLEIDVGAKKPFRALHFSDSHLNFMSAAEQVNDGAKRAFKNRVPVFPQSLVNFQASVDYARRNSLLMLHTGDLVDYESEANYAISGRTLGNMADFHFAIGNHEYWNPKGGKSRDEIRERVRKAFANDVQVASRVVNGVNFVAFDDANNNVSADVCRRVKDEFAKGLPVVLMMHVPFYTPATFEWSFVTLGCGERAGTADITGVPAEIVRSKYRANQIDYNVPRPPTLELMAFLKEQRTLKSILCGHMHSAFSDRFSETAMQYVVGGNFKGDACEILFT